MGAGDDPDGAALSREATTLGVEVARSVAVPHPISETATNSPTAWTTRRSGMDDSSCGEL
jgi:hypothetical protein